MAWRSRSPDSPGAVKTSVHAGKTHDFLAALHPVGRTGESSDIVHAVIHRKNAPCVTARPWSWTQAFSAGH